MGEDVTMLLGTIGTGIWRSADGGDTWARPKGSRPKLPWSELQAFALAVHPKDPKVLYAGTNEGIYRSDDQGSSFQRLESAVNDYDVWSIAIDPVQPDTVFCGCRPGAVFRSRDGGQHWEKLAAEFAEECANIRIPRVLTMAVDPRDNRIVWAGAEVDGVRRSLDGGDTWTTVGAAVAPGEIGEGLNDPDIHGMVVSPGSPTMVMTSTASEVFTSTDVGESWKGVGARQNFPMRFCRGITLKADDPNVVFVGNGDGNVGVTGAVMRSQDRGESWETMPLPVEPNSPIWKFGVHQADPDLVLCFSHWGEVFHSEDAGDTWGKFSREFAEIRSIVWTPN